MNTLPFLVIGVSCAISLFHITCAVEDRVPERNRCVFWKIRAGCYCALQLFLMGNFIVVCHSYRTEPPTPNAPHITIPVEPTATATSKPNRST